MRNKVCSYYYMVVKKRRRLIKKPMADIMQYAFQPYEDLYPMYNNVSIKGFRDKPTRINAPYELPKMLSKDIKPETEKIDLTTPKTTTTKTIPKPNLPKTGGIFNSQIGGNYCDKVDLKGTGKCSMDPGGVGGTQMLDIGFDILKDTISPIGWGVAGYEALSGEQFPVGGASTKKYNEQDPNFGTFKGYNLGTPKESAQSTNPKSPAPTDLGSYLNLVPKEITNNPIVENFTKGATDNPIGQWVKSNFNLASLNNPVSTSKGESIYKPSPGGTTGNLFANSVQAKAPLLPK